MRVHYTQVLIHSDRSINFSSVDFGGWDPTTGQCDDSLHVLHTARKEWNRPPIQGQLPTPRHSHSGCSVGTTMYVFGGQVDNYYLGDIAAFDMKTSMHLFFLLLLLIVHCSTHLTVMI